MEKISGEKFIVAEFIKRIIKFDHVTITVKSNFNLKKRAENQVILYDGLKRLLKYSNKEIAKDIESYQSLREEFGNPLGLLWYQEKATKRFLLKYIKFLFNTSDLEINVKITTPEYSIT